MAGLGESCSHVAAVLFYLEYAVRIQGNKTVTQDKAYWMPPTLKEVEYSEIKDIDFMSSKSMKHKMDKRLQAASESPQSTSPTTSKNSFASDQELDDFYAKLNTCGAKASILSIVPPFSKQFKPDFLENNNFSLAATFYEPENLNLNYKELLDKAKDISISLSQHEVEYAEKVTKKQAASSEWFSFRAGRITASKLYDMCKTSIVSPAKSLIKAICYPHSYRFTSKATSWGCKHEEIAKEKYKELMSGKHTKLSFSDSGLFISIDEPYLAATPDSLVECQCCGKGCVEIKCPYCIRETQIFEGIEKKKFCLLYQDDKTSLKKSHPYYYQIQSQLFCTKRSYCDFFVWTEKDFHHERIRFDARFFENCLEESKKFFKHCILIEVLGKFYTVPRNTCLPLAKTTATDRDSYCYCEGPEEGDMIGCDNESCPYQWFHLECLDMKIPKTKKWFYPDCLMAKEFSEI